MTIEPTVQREGSAATVLVAMRPEYFGPYLHAAIAAYAEDNVAAKRWPAKDALERSRADFLSSLPLGLATPNNHLFEIRADAGGPTLGALWFAVEESHGLRSAFVFDVHIKAEWRRQGHGYRALKALEPLVAALGLDDIGLHVFGHNPGAQALYARLGYAVTGINMSKRLGAGG